jgi:hypothetical protein
MMVLLPLVNFTFKSMINQIEEKIKELYGSKASFCEAQGYDYKNFAKKLRTVENQTAFLNDFLKPLNLQVTIQEREEKKQG